jgi:hypothetical protein
MMNYAGCCMGMFAVKLMVLLRKLISKLVASADFVIGQILQRDKVTKELRIFPTKFGIQS